MTRRIEVAAATDMGIEGRILDLLADGDEELHIGDSLTVLLHVVASLCCQATTPEPMDLATEFGVELRQAVAREQSAPRWLS